MYGTLSGTFTPPETGVYTLDIYNYRTNAINTIINYIDQVIIRPVDSTLANNPAGISVSTGATSKLTFTGPTELSNKNYIILGGSHGSVPGRDIGGYFLPLNADFLTYFIIDHANNPIFENFEGVISPPGYAEAFFNTLGPVPPSLSGTSIVFTLVVLDGPRTPPIHHISNPVLVFFY